MKSKKQAGELLSTYKLWKHHSCTESVQLHVVSKCWKHKKLIEWRNNKTGNLLNNSRLPTKLNYTLLFMRFYIYFCKLQNKALTLPDFAKQIEFTYPLEKLIDQLYVVI